ncbi:MAG: hypothetical protein HFJ17_04660 [Clostridia bacterium]|nr:hypothetical protein [Clostridia bacterium]
MATNPMQRKARNSFILGMVITLLFAAIIIFFLWQNTQKLSKDLQTQKSKIQKAYALNKDIDVGEVITADMLKEVEVVAGTTPSNYTDVNNYIGLLLEQANDETLTADKIVLKAAINLKANTLLTTSMISNSGTIDDIREKTYNMITLPIDLDTGDYVDIRLALPNGQDYIVLSKLKVTIPDVGGMPVADSIKMNIAEGDLLTLSSAIVESYEIEGSNLYAIKYVEADMQKAATETYVPTAQVINQIEKNPNIVQQAMAGIRQRWTNDARTARNEYINKQQRTEDGAKTGITKNTEKDRAAREQYLTSLYGGVAQ